MPPVTPTTLPPTPMIITFAVLVIGFLILDLGILNRRAHVVKFKESLLWSSFWVILALAFAGGVYHYLGQDPAITFLTGYVVEMSLSVDNLFVFLLIFSAFRIPAELQHRVLFWGIVGALGMRAVCIGAGVAALQRFHWLLYIFGAVLIYGGIKTMLKKDGDEDDPSKGAVARLVRKIVPVTPDLHGNHFFVKLDGKTFATPLFLALVVIEVSDLVFAVDSIPAVLAISQDPFIVYTSNVFAILGLRSIYFALAHLLQIFRYLKYAISLILIFVGAKIALANVFKVPVGIALGVILFLLLAAVLLSVIIKPAPGAPGDAAEGKKAPPA